MIMVKKKTTKNVLDYDPLAWLGEPEKNSESGGIPTVKKEVESESAAYGFFSDTEDELEESPDQVSAGTTVEDSEAEQGFGFFNDDDNVSSSQVSTQLSVDNVIQLGAELTIRNAAECKTLIDEQLSTGMDIVLAASDLQKIDTSGVQLIYSLKKTLQKTGQSIQWQSESSLINQAANLLGLEDLYEAQDSDAFGFFTDDLPPQQNTNEGQNEESIDEGFGFF